MGGAAAVNVLVTGHDGYIGSVLVPLLQEAGHDVVGLDSFLYAGCSIGEPAAPVPALAIDVRDVQVEDLEPFEAVVHLAAVSSDPLGDVNPAATYAINYRASVRLARLAKRAGVRRFVFASSCSLYGASGADLLDETDGFDPATPFGRSKVLAEQDMVPLADARFTPTYLRGATAYGFSPRLRGDLVLNDLVGLAVTTGEVPVPDDDTAWRPLVHVEDVCRAVLAILDAPAEAVRNEAFNVGSTSENYRLSELARIVASIVPGSRVVRARHGRPAPRSYRVSAEKIRRALPSFSPRWTVETGARQLHDAYVRCGLTRDDLESSRFRRVRRVEELRAAGVLDETLHRVVPSPLDLAVHV